MSKSKAVAVRIIPSGVRVNVAALEAAGARVNYGDGSRVTAPLSDTERDALLAALEADPYVMINRAK